MSEILTYEEIERICREAVQIGITRFKITGGEPLVRKGCADLIRMIRDEGVTIMMIEHNMSAVMSLCDRLVVLDHGSKIAEGLPEEIRKNEQVIEAYLGREE